MCFVLTACNFQKPSPQGYWNDLIYGNSSKAKTSCDVVINPWDGIVDDSSPVCTRYQQVQTDYWLPVENGIWKKYHSIQYKCIQKDFAFNVRQEKLRTQAEKIKSQELK